MNMDNQRSPLLGVSFSYYCQGKSVEDELRSSLWYTKLEFEQTKLAVQEELKKKDDQLTQLKELLNKAMRERDEAHEKCQSLFLEKVFLQQQQQQQTLCPNNNNNNNNNLSGISSVEKDHQSSSECEETSIVSSPMIELEMVCDIIDHHQKPLPEKGKLLQAVMKAGPLLQTLLLAGPLPQWRHPPPPLESFEIPPVSLLQQDHSFLSKRPLSHSQHDHPNNNNNKYQRIN